MTEESRFDPLDDLLIPGLYRTILVPSQDDNINNNGQDQEKSFFPKKGALVEVLIKGLKGQEIIFPERNLEYFLGDGFMEGLPCGLDGALLHFRTGESSILRITENDLMLPIVTELTATSPISDGYCYYVTLKKFQNLPEFPEEYSIEDRLVLCDKLNTAAKRLLDANQIPRALLKYDTVRVNLEDFAILVKVVPQEFGVKRMVLLLKSLIGMSTCLLKLEYSNLDFAHDLHLSDGSEASAYVIRALVLKPDSVDALLLLADIHILRKEPQQALDLFAKIHKIQPNNPDNIRLQVVECIRQLKEARVLEMKMATKMLGLDQL